MIRILYEFRNYLRPNLDLWQKMQFSLQFKVCNLKSLVDVINCSVYFIYMSVCLNIYLHVCSNVYVSV